MHSTIASEGFNCNVSSLWYILWKFYQPCILHYLVVVSLRYSAGLGDSELRYSRCTFFDNEDAYNWEPKNSSCNSRYHSIHSSENKKNSSFFKKNSKKIEWYLKFFRVWIELYLKWMKNQVDTRKKLEFHLKKSSSNRVYIQIKSSRMRVITRLYIQLSLEYIYLLHKNDSK